MRQGWGRYFNPSRGAATNGILCKVREWLAIVVGTFYRLQGGGVLSGLFASKPAPTFDRILTGRTLSTVGAGLLAKAPAQTPSNLADIGASTLENVLQGFFHFSQISHIGIKGDFQHIIAIERIGICRRNFYLQQGLSLIHI